jgi:hypothetical protein
MLHGCNDGVEHLFLIVTESDIAVSVRLLNRVSFGTGELGQQELCGVALCCGVIEVAHN